MILSHRSRRVSNLRKKSPDGHCLTGAFLYWNQWAGLFGHKGIESLGFRGHLTLDFPVINKLEILEEKFSTLMTQIQPDKGLEWLSVSELSEYLPTHPVEHTIYCWTSNKQIPFHKKGKRIMFLKSEIDEWMQDNKSRSRAEIMNEAIAYVQSTRKVI